MSTNFTVPSYVPDYFGQSVTPGSQTQVPIAPGAPGLAPVGTGIGIATTPNPPPASQVSPVPVGTDPVTGQPDWVLPDVNVNTPVVVGGQGSGGSAPNTGSGLDPGALANPSGDPTAPLTGIGNPITQGQQGLAAIGGFFGNWFVRLAIIALGIVLIAAAAWELSKERQANA